MTIQVLHCPSCQGTDMVRHVKSPEGKQRWRCREKTAVYVKDATMCDDKLIEFYIEINPHYPTQDEARLKQYGVAVWAIMAHLRAIGGDVAQVAQDYALPKEAVEAAIAYYHKHKHLIDARIVANVA